MNAIEVTNLTKYYGSFKALDQINISIKQGEIHGFLGPNGAGKTSTIRILVGLMGASNGSATIFNQKSGDKNTKKLVGYLPSDFGLPKQYTIGQYLDLIEKVRGKGQYRDELVTRFKVDENRKLNQLSKGNRQKVSIVQALMHEPKIVIADEPTSGLDPLLQNELNNYFQEYVDRGGTVFVSSHILADVQGICNNITVIKEGRIVSSGSIDDLLKTMPRKILLSLSKDADPNIISQELSTKSISKELDKFVIYVEGNIKEAVSKIIQNEKIIDFSIPQPSLEAYFKDIYSDEI